jgi:predicted nucleic acid-binding protein
MKDIKRFIDTNILVYAHDKDAGGKHAQAKEIVLEMWEQKTLPSISIQVLQEFYINLCRKHVPLKAARELVEAYLAWEVIENTASLLVEGIKNTERFKISFWDALIITAAQQSGAQILYSEDLNDGQKYGTVMVQNPFRQDGQ